MQLVTVKLPKIIASTENENTQPLSRTELNI